MANRKKRNLSAAFPERQALRNIIRLCEWGPAQNTPSVNQRMAEVLRIAHETLGRRGWPKPRRRNAKP